MEQLWTQAEIETTTAGVEPVGAVLLELGLGGYMVQDAADFEEFLQGKQGRWDYIDDELMKLREAPTVLTAYIAQNAQGAENLSALRQELARLKALDTEKEWGRLSLELCGLNEADWENAWKRYYKPSKIGSRLVVCPSWEEYDPAPGEVVMQLDPGMAFGSGTHETTRLCLAALDEFNPSGRDVLDVGCGSGILSVAAMLLGAGSALGVDIDENAVRVAVENADFNRVAAKYRCADLTSGVTGQYDIIFANIVADAIRMLSPEIPRFLSEGGVFIASGIIDTRERETTAAIEAAGLKIVRRREQNGWVCLCAQMR